MTASTAARRPVTSSQDIMPCLSSSSASSTSSTSPLSSTTSPTRTCSTKNSKSSTVKPTKLVVRKTTKPKRIHKIVFQKSRFILLPCFISACLLWYGRVLLKMHWHLGGYWNTDEVDAATVHPGRVMMLTKMWRNNNSSTNTVEDRSSKHLRPAAGVSRTREGMKQHGALDEEEVDEEEWASGNIVYVLHTRFMQHQGNLTALGLARAKLFESFCFPTIANQTDPNFLWIIRADPDLSPVVKSIMINLLRPHSNFLLVASNQNDVGWDLGFGHDEVAQDTMDVPKVWSGDVNVAKRFHEAASPAEGEDGGLADRETPAVVIETRLDADDGLDLNFVRYMKAAAYEHFFNASQLEQDSDHGEEVKQETQETQEEEGEETSNQTKTTEISYHRPKWFYWCSISAFHWHPIQIPFPLEARNPSSPSSSSHGILTVESESNCVTPGLTIVYDTNVVTKSDIPLMPHHQLHYFVHPCRTAKRTTECLKVTGAVPWAIRARTATSAGMKGVEIDHHGGGGGGGNTTVDTSDSMNNASQEQDQQQQQQQQQQQDPNTSNTQLAEVAARQEEFWTYAKHKMALDTVQISQTRQYLQDHVLEIAKDNLLGQCTAGHSCKKRSKEKLLKLLGGHGDEGEMENADTQQEQ